MDKISNRLLIRDFEIQDSYVFFPPFFSLSFYSEYSRTLINSEGNGNTRAVQLTPEDDANDLNVERLNSIATRKPSRCRVDYQIAMRHSATIQTPSHPIIIRGRWSTAGYMATQRAVQLTLEDNAKGSMNAQIASQHENHRVVELNTKSIYDTHSLSKHFHTPK